MASKVKEGTRVSASQVSKNLKPGKTVAEFSRAGISSNPALPADMPVSLLELEQSHGPEYWLTSNNFYVITRYNRSPLYAMAVYQLSEAIRDAYQKDQS